MKGRKPIFAEPTRRVTTTIPEKDYNALLLFAGDGRTISDLARTLLLIVARNGGNRNGEKPTQG